MISSYENVGVVNNLFFFQTILAVQRTKNKVQFVPVQQSGIQVPNLDCTKEYFQSSKSKSAIVQG